MAVGGQVRARIVLRGSAAALAAAAARTDTPFADPAVAVVIVEPADASLPALAALRGSADRHDLAFLVADDAEIASALGADGVEIAWAAQAYAEARKTVGRDRSVGCRVGLSRHDAMLAGEAGADYVALGGAIADDERFKRLVEMTAWWAEIFEVACVAIGARSPDQAARLAAAGADFVDLPPELWAGRPGAILDIAAAKGRLER